MKAKLVAIGNSKGIRIPATLLKQCRIQDQVDLEVVKDGIVIRPVESKTRAGWDDAFRAMHEREEDTLLFDEAVDMEPDNNYCIDDNEDP